MEKATVRAEENVSSIDRMLSAHLEAGDMLVKQLGYLVEARGAGVVLGARVSIILTSRADTVLARMASCAVALVAARRGYSGAVTETVPRSCRSVGVVG